MSNNGVGGIATSAAPSSSSVPAPNAIRTPPPPGFYGAAMGASSAGNDNCNNNGVGTNTATTRGIYGEELRASSALSSPVYPPGFVGTATKTTTADALKAATSLAPPQSGITRSGSGGRRSTSYTQLADALGEGLAESMDDSANGGGDAAALREPLSIYQTSSIVSQNKPADERGNSMIAGSLSRGYETTGSPATMDNFTRQGRHTASRLIGSSNTTAIDAMEYRALNDRVQNSGTIRNTSAGPTSFLSPEQLMGGKSTYSRERNVGHTSSSASSMFDGRGGQLHGIPALIPPNVPNGDAAPSGTMFNHTTQVGLTVVEPYTPSGGASPAVGPEKGGTNTPKSYELATSPGLTAVKLAPQHPQTANHASVVPASSLREAQLHHYQQQQQNTDELLGNVTQRMIHLGVGRNGNHGSLQNAVASVDGRSSAPPAQSSLHCSSSAGASVLASHAASSLQKRAAELQNEINPGQWRLQQHQQQQHTQQHQVHNAAIGGRVGDVNSHAIRSSPSGTPEPGKQTRVSNHNGHRHMAVPVTTNSLTQSAAEREEAIRRNEEELSPFLRDVMEPMPHDSSGSISCRPSARPSRGLAILQASSLHVPDVRSTCEAFGVLDSFRAEFLESHGVIFLTYHDLRSAQYAAIELPSCLERLATTAGSQAQHQQHKHSVMVRYCIPLNSSSANDESMILLSSLPREVDEQSLSMVMKSYGAVRAVHYQADSDGNGRSSYMVEFYDVQDARQAIMELESTQPWGGEVTVSFGANSSERRKLGRDLLSLIGRWRHGGIAKTASHANTMGGVVGTGAVPHMIRSGDHAGFSPSLSSASRTPPLPSISPVPMGMHSSLGSEAKGSSHSLTSAGTNNTRNIIVSARTSTSPALSSVCSSPMPQAPDLSKSRSPAPAVSNISGYESLHGAENGTHNAKDLGGESDPAASSASQQRQTTQLVVGPDGQYSYVMVNSAYQTGNIVSAPHPAAAPAHASHIDPHASPGSEQVLIDLNHHQSQQHVVHGPLGTYTTSLPPQLIPHSHPTPHPHVQHHYWHPPPQHNPNSMSHPSAPHSQYHHHITAATAGGQGATVVSSPYGDIHGYQAVVPVYATHLGSVPQQPVGDGYSSVSSGSSGPGNQRGTGKAQRHKAGRGRNNGSNLGVTNVSGQHNGSGVSGGGDDGDSPDQLALDIQSVKSGKDRRSSLMVRNIPNKYTQSMLLSEFAAGNHGPDKIDFFYLPIDFKNRCNRGYAFVNFVDYQDIVSFHELYNGKNWKNFNSDKICDITYARIQGKEGMLKRFENSALMEKDDEYRPLVFVSHGINKGKREEFPSAVRS